jgi:hypothetical protein
MSLPWGCHVHRGKDGLTYAYTRKKPIRKTPYPQHINRFDPLPREKACIIKLRKLGYSTNMLSKALGRSTSYVYRVIRKAEMLDCLRWIDMRKLPNKTRKWCRPRRWKTLMNLWQQWEAWMLGEGERPP